MRRKKHKHTRRAVAFYKVHHGMREPFKVLLDGNFIHAARSCGLPEVDKHLENLLGGRAKTYVTPCVMAELRGLGTEFRDSAAAARQVQLHYCGHGDGGSGGATTVAAAECLLQQVGDANTQRWWVGTQDRALRRALADVPGAPLLFVSINGMHLEQPSDAAKAAAAPATDAGGSAVPVYERASAPLADLDAITPKLRTSAKFRRNKAKGPNPLAARKKVEKKATAKPAAAAAAAAGAAGGNSCAAKRKRRRKRGGGDGKGGGGDD